MAAESPPASSRPSVRSLHPTGAFVELPVTRSWAEDRLSPQQTAAAGRIRPLLPALAGVEEAAAIAATSLFQILLGLGSDAPPVLIASGGISLLVDIFVTGPVNAALQRPLLQCILLLTQDVKKYCIPEVINERLVQGVVSLLRANSEARFDSVVEAGPALAAEAAGIARDCLQLLTSLAGSDVKHLLWNASLISAAGCVARRMCALVGCGTSPSGSSIESQAIESLADPTATALDADGPAATSGIELAVDVFPAVFTQTLSLFSALARGSDEAKQCLLESGVTVTLLRLLNEYCPVPPEIEGGSTLGYRQLPPLFTCPFGTQLVLTCHDVTQGHIGACDVTCHTLLVDGLYFSLYELWNLQRLVGAAVACGGVGGVPLLLLSPQAMHGWAWTSDGISFQELSDADPHSRFLALCMLLSSLASVSAEFSTFMSDAITQAPLEQWMHPEWVNADGSWPHCPPSPLSCVQPYSSLTSACVSALRAHADEEEVTECLTVLRELVTLAGDAEDSAGGNVPVTREAPSRVSMVMSPVGTTGAVSTGNLINPSPGITGRFSFGATGISGQFPSMSMPALPRTSDVVVTLQQSPLLPSDKGAGDPAAAVFAAFCVFHAYPAIDVLTSALQNIDNDVMLLANEVLACLLAAYPPGRLVLNAAGGLDALAECLYDYDPDIRRAALQCASLLASPSSRPSLIPFGSDLIVAGIPDPQSRQTGSHLQPPPGFDLSDALRKSGVLPHVLRIAAQWPSDDVTHDVAIAAVWVLAHATASSRDNQEFLGRVGASEVLVLIAARCIINGASTAADDPSASESISRLLEATVTAMGNLAVNNPVVQSRVVTNGTLSLLSRLLAGLFLDLSFLEAGGGEVLCKRTRSEGKEEDEQGEGEEETTERKGETSAVPLLDAELRSPEACGGAIDALFSSVPITCWMFTQSPSPGVSIAFSTAASIVNSSLIALINSLAGSTVAQASLDTAPFAQFVCKLLEAPRSPDPREQPSVLHLSHRKPGCMLLSHLVSVNAFNRERYSNPAVVSLLLGILEDVRPTAERSIQRISSSISEPSPTHAPSRRSPDAQEAIEEYVGDALGISSVGDDAFPNLQIATTEMDEDCAAANPNALIEALETAELRVCALTCLVNAVFKNVAVQEWVGANGGIPLVTSFLALPDPAVTKAAAFCLGNLVRDCPNNGRLLVASGGVEALIDVINDVNDDDASKKAFATLSQCGSGVVHRLLLTVEAALLLFPARTGFPDDIFRRLDDCLAGGESPIVFTGSPHALAWLDKCLPVLNGLIITRPSNKRWLLKSTEDDETSSVCWVGGLWPFLRLLAIDVPEEVSLYAGIVLTNVTAGPHAHIQSLVSSNTALLESMVASALWFAKYSVHSPQATQESVAPVPEGCAVLYGILTNVCAGSVSLSSSLSHCGPLLSQLIAHTAIDGSPEAVELFLSLCERAADDAALSEMVGSSPPVADSIDWGTLGDVCPTAASLSEGLRAIQAGADPRSVPYLRAEQCLQQISGSGSKRGVGLALWK